MARQPVAVKQVPLDDDEAAVAMQRELKALRALRHPNVVALLGALTDDDEGLLWAVLEFAPHGSLHRMLHRSSESDMRACFGDAKALPGLGEAFGASRPAFAPRSRSCIDVPSSTATSRRPTCCWATAASPRSRTLA